MGVTFEVRVHDFHVGLEWYERLFARTADFKPHELLAEWEVAPNCWLQVSPGSAVRCGAIRFAVEDIEAARGALIAVGVNVSVPERISTVLRCDFEDPFGNELGFFQDVEPISEGGQ